MMNLTEKAAYLKGLMEGLELDESTKEAKIFKAMAELLDDIALSVADLEDGYAELEEYIEEIDEDLGMVEDDFYGDEEECDGDCDCCCDCDDEEEIDEDDYFEVECPECSSTIYLDDDLIDSGKLVCPECGKAFEIKVDDCDCVCCGEDNE